MTSARVPIRATDPGSHRSGWEAAHALDNPAWHALTGPHAGVADVAGPARRYDPTVSVFAAVDRLDDDGWAALAELVGAGRRVLLARVDVPAPPAGWVERRRLRGDQMTLTIDPSAPPVPESVRQPPPTVRPLSAADVPDMLALARRTQPGPFLAGTIGLGGYVGVHDRGDRLVAMAGRRMALPGHVEVSAVCTEPDAAGQGFATELTARVARSILADGATPFLHVAEDNRRARRVYERLGFTVRATVDFVVAEAPGEATT